MVCKSSSVVFQFVDNPTLGLFLKYVLILGICGLSPGEVSLVPSLKSSQMKLYPLVHEHPLRPPRRVNSIGWAQLYPFDWDVGGRWVGPRCC